MIFLFKWGDSQVLYTSVICGFNQPIRKNMLVKLSSFSPKVLDEHLKKKLSYHHHLQDFFWKTPKREFLTPTLRDSMGFPNDLRGNQVLGILFILTVFPGCRFRKKFPGPRIPWDSNGIYICSLPFLAYIFGVNVGQLFQSHGASGFWGA